MIISPSKDDGKKFASHCYGFHRDGRRIGGCTCALVDVASSSQGCRGGSRPRETGTTPGATWNRGWISKPSALWSKNRGQLYGIFRLRELEKESARDKGSATDREGGKFLVQIEISMEEYFSLSSFPSPSVAARETAGGSSSPLWGKNLKNKFRISTNLRSTRWNKIFIHEA